MITRDELTYEDRSDGYLTRRLLDLSMHTFNPPTNGRWFNKWMCFLNHKATAVPKEFSNRVLSNYSGAAMYCERCGEILEMEPLLQGGNTIKWRRYDTLPTLNKKETNYGRDTIRESI